MHLRKTTVNLPVKLSPAEIDMKGREVARQAAEVDKLETEEKARAKVAKSAIEGEKTKLGRLTRETNDGVEIRPIECELNLHEGTMLVETIRLDTGEVVGQRPANNVELEELERSRQVKMPLTERQRRLRESEGA